MWLAAREVGIQAGCNPRRLALPAAALVAFNPQFLFNSASVNNDNLITLLASLIIWQSWPCCATVSRPAAAQFSPCCSRWRH